jgi:hypothetical protein
LSAPPSESSSASYPAKALQALCLQQSRADFERRHPHPWLVHGLKEEAPEEISQHTVLGAGLGAPGGSGLLGALSLQSDDITFYPLRSRPSSPSPERLSVGRSRDNDVVLQHPSVSKVHAHLVQKGGQWQLTDAESKNGTFMNFRPAPRGEGLPVRDRAIIKFGSMSCTVLMSSGELYDALVQKVARGPQA